MVDMDRREIEGKKKRREQVMDVIGRVINKRKRKLKKRMR